MGTILIHIADTPQFLSLITLIEDYNLSLPKIVTYVGKPTHVVPTEEQLNAPYTSYNTDNNTMWADEVVLALAAKNNIVYTEV